MDAYVCKQNDKVVSVVCYVRKAVPVSLSFLLERMGKNIVNKNKLKVPWVDYMFSIDEDGVGVVYHKNRNCLFGRWSEYVRICVEKMEV